MPYRLLGVDLLFISNLFTPIQGFAVSVITCVYVSVCYKRKQEPQKCVPYFFISHKKGLRRK